VTTLTDTPALVGKWKSIGESQTLLAVCVCIYVLVSVDICLSTAQICTDALDPEKNIPMEPRSKIKTLLDFKYFEDE